MKSTYMCNFSPFIAAIPVVGSSLVDGTVHGVTDVGMHKALGDPLDKNAANREILASIAAASAAGIGGTLTAAYLYKQLKKR